MKQLNLPLKFHQDTKPSEPKKTQPKRYTFSEAILLSQVLCSPSDLAATWTDSSDALMKTMKVE